MIKITWTEFVAGVNESFSSELNGNFEKIMNMLTTSYSLQSTILDNGVVLYNVGDGNIRVDTEGGQGAAKAHGYWHITADIGLPENMYIQLEVVSISETANDNALFSFGFFDTTLNGSTPDTNYILIYIRNNATKIELSVEDGGSNTSGGEIAQTIQAGDILRLEWTTSRAEFFVNGVSKTAVTTNIHTGRLKPFITAIDNDSGNAMDVDVSVKNIILDKVS